MSSLEVYALARWISGAGDGCICPGCRTQRLAGDVAERVTNLPHQDLSEMVILRHFAPSAYLDGAHAPLAAVQIRPGGDRARPFLRALLGDVATDLELKPHNGTAPFFARRAVAA